MGAGADTPVNAGDQLATLDEVVEISDCCCFSLSLHLREVKLLGVFQNVSGSDFLNWRGMFGRGASVFEAMWQEVKEKIIFIGN